MIEFLHNYWYVITAVIADLVTFIIVMLIRKNKISSDAVRSMIADVVPDYIRLAEVSASQGKTKFYMVVDLVYKRIKKYTSSKDESFWLSYIGEVIENILDTPQKKGDLTDEKKIAK